MWLVGDVLSVFIAATVLLAFRWAQPNEDLTHPLAAGPQVQALCMSDIAMATIDFAQSILFMDNSLPCRVEGRGYDVLQTLCECIPGSLSSPRTS